MLGEAPTEPSSATIDRVEGLLYVADFVSAREEQRLLKIIDEATWSPELKRRVQHYGYRYDYLKRGLSHEDYLGPIPAWAHELAQRLVEHRIFHSPPDQVIVNEYMPGQGIAAHVDRETCFGDVVASLSLGSRTVMEFTRSGERLDVPLAPHSVVALRGAARYLWRHGIIGRRSDRINGQVLERSRRVSLTFRTVRIPD